MRGRFLIFSLLALVPSALMAQERVADSLHRACDFRAAVDMYESLIADSSDSLRIQALESKLLLAENAEAMSGFVYEPSVVAKHVFPLADFYLYYPMQDRSWRTIPNRLDSLPDTRVTACYVPDGAEQIYFSRSGGTGFRNIYRTERKDSIWTVPQLVNENLMSAANEIYPVLSGNGRSLYFASDGLYGAGGYDLYVSRWNESTGDWDAPENMGFPFSSPYDDFLYVESEDGRYAVFASNRECSADSVCVYVLEYESVPVRREVRDPQRLREILSLQPADESGRLDNGASVAGDMPENEDTRRYMDKMSQVRLLRDSLDVFVRRLDGMRQDFAVSTDDDERSRLTDEIMAGESRLPLIREALGKATAELQRIEMDFLFKGVVIDPDKFLAKVDRKVVSQSAAYTFTRMNTAPLPEMEFEVPVSRFDYSFKVLPEGRMAENQALPEGVVYQIHFITLPVQATTRQLKGLSPVYETVRPDGNYVYRAGIFSRYSDALDNLNTVKSVGFRSASVVAFIDGKSVPVSKARAAEDVRTFWQVNVNTGTDLLPAFVLDVIHGYCSKDIAKVMSEDGIVLFTVAPFERREDAEELEALIRDAGLESVSVCEIK